MDQMEQIVYEQITYAILWLSYSNTWNHSTVRNNSSGSFKNIIQNVFTNHIYI